MSARRRLFIITAPCLVFWLLAAVYVVEWLS